jgi:ATP-dependent Clp protease protease subunit
MALVPMVLEQDGRSERSFDLYSMMLRQRIIFCNGQVEDNMANLIVAQLLYLESQDDKGDIHMYINSPGGSVTAGLAIASTMQFIKPDVATTCMGLAASMGSFLLAAGAKGKRSSLKDTSIMIHQPSSGMGRSSVTDMGIHFNEVQKTKQKLTQYYSDWTGRPYDELFQKMERDCYMTPEEALELGLIDKIITKRGE